MGIYLVLLANWEGVAAGRAAAWQPLLMLAGTVLVPVIYTRRIVDFGPC